MEIQKIEPQMLTQFVVDELCSIVNTVYDETEGDLFLGGMSRRTNPRKLQELSEAGSLYAAMEGNKPAGMIVISYPEENVADFSMLAVGPKFQGQGLARQIMDFAESTAKDSGAVKVEAVLLQPASGNHSYKEFLKGWYTRLGWEEDGELPFSSRYPKAAARTKTPCKLIRITKSL